MEKWRRLNEIHKEGWALSLVFEFKSHSKCSLTQICKILKKIERTINIAVVILRQLHLENKLQQVTMNHQLFCKAGRRWVAYQIVKYKTLTRH